ncbi:uncharacterized protein LAESUDRAFT_793799 [Laetiporus sulphureus 93-53]|uniref:Uncharacterized protein n=1 Tax=Laetiporus sulphureus 93-53 TaxID=1314785 RepID=A0A165GL29_9APHY|nr:uncharacterized protein LAESUDRAFT_793799 [Laetiporus sulphureus 93-53]KZT10499.1 hypothetical protein LAESUDRAFT_793799 [Laetiporus sulphureus 93-53]
MSPTSAGDIQHGRVSGWPAPVPRDGVLCRRRDHVLPRHHVHDARRRPSGSTSPKGSHATPCPNAGVTLGGRNSTCTRQIRSGRHYHSAGAP